MQFSRESMALYIVKSMDMIVVKGNKIETAMAFKKLKLIYVSVIGLTQDQHLWNIKKICKFLKGIEKNSEHDLAACQNSQV